MDWNAILNTTLGSFAALFAWFKLVPLVMKAAKTASTP